MEVKLIPLTNCKDEFTLVDEDDYDKTKIIHIGYFANKEDAAKAYNEKASELFGEFAKLNKIMEEK